MAKRVYMPTGKVLPLYAAVDAAPRYSAVGEVPCHRMAYEDGEVLVYGTRRAVVELRAVPIRVVMPWTLAEGVFSWGVRGEVRREMVAMLRKVLKVHPAPESPGSGAEDAVLFPTLWEHLTAQTYPDGEKRETSSIIIVADASGWRGCLSDKDNGRTMWKTAGTVEALLAALEDGAAKDDPSEWRASQWAKGKGKKRG